MARSKRDRRRRVGRVSVYPHHGAWWLYYRDGGKVVRRKVADNVSDAEKIAAQVNAQLAVATPTLLEFEPLGVAELCRRFFDFHENVVKSSLGTIRRYRAALRHLEDFSRRGEVEDTQAHLISPDRFAGYLRSKEVAPNGHPNTARRRLRDKGVVFILETCRSLYSFAAKRRHLPPYASNPFAELPLDRLKIEDSKPIFVFDEKTEVAFLHASDFWDFVIHFTLAKTGLRIGELVHLLIEDLDLDRGWLRVRNKTALGWRIKTGSERDVPLISEVVAVLRRTVGDRRVGPVFLRERFACRGDAIPLVGDRVALERECESRQRAAGETSRVARMKIARTVWRDAGAVKPDAIRNSFIRICRSIGRPQATCPKSWRHTFATLLQDANVDPLIRQITLGHSPTAGNGLGMTGNYTHTRPETQRHQIEQALRLWPASLALTSRTEEGASK